MSRPAGQAAVPQRITRVVAEVVADKLERSGGPALSAEALLADAQLRERNFAALGLTSLDWMDVATGLENLLGVELPDDVLLDPASRSVAGWSAQLHRLGVGGEGTERTEGTGALGALTEREASHEADRTW